MRLYKAVTNLFILTYICLIYTDRLTAQCGTTITTFPYVEDFETSQGGWVSGGTSNDWAWGTPSKPVINHAGSGSKCWIVGGLTTSFYNYGERSYVKSPCFDFTNVQHPYIQFLIWWESEWRYDGINLEYSLDVGTTWNNVGAFSDPVDCMDDNWYNESNITYLQGLSNPKSGWCGNIQASQGGCQGGNGSNGWKTAKHCLSGLGGMPSVMFRFAFGAGTNCNSFDGIAFDSIAIGNAPPVSGSFSYLCVDSNTVAFSATTGLCSNNVLWNFNDPASGAANTSSSINPTHIFSTAGTHTISLILNGPCNAPDTITQTFNCTSSVCNLIVAVNAQNGLCGNTGSMTATATGAGSTYIYSWSNGDSSQSITGLTPGTYSVTVSALPGCTATDSATIIGSTNILNVTHTTQNGTCGGLGSIKTQITGGSSSYSYTWSNGATTQNLTGLNDGIYSVTVSTAEGCSGTDSAIITNATGTGSITISPHSVTIGLGQTTVLTAVSENTNGVFIWSPLDDINCDTCSTIVVGPPATVMYHVSVAGSNGCLVNDSTLVTVIPDYYLYIPNAFTPNGDGNNDYFQVFIRFPEEIKLWTITVFDRWGEEVFESNDMNFKWDGIYKGKLLEPGVCVYIAQAVFLNGYVRNLKGSVTLLR